MANGMKNISMITMCSSLPILNIFSVNSMKIEIQNEGNWVNCNPVEYRLHWWITLIRVTKDYYYPDWVCLVDFFAIWGWKIAGVSGWGLNPPTLDLCSQSGAYDLSAMATLYSNERLSQYKKVGLKTLGTR